MKTHKLSIVITASLAAMATIFLGSCSDEPTPPASSVIDEPLEEVTFGGSTAVNSRFTDNGFSQDDHIYLYHMSSESSKFSIGYNLYTYDNGSFIPLNDDSKIMKKRSETFQYAAFTNFENFTDSKWYFPSGRDVLGSLEETADMNVDLLFIHIPAKLLVEVTNVPSNSIVYNVSLQDVIKSYSIDKEKPFYYDADFSNSNRSVRSMTRVSTNNYEYYLAPVQTANANQVFIVVELSNGTRYQFTPPADTEFDANTLYQWQVDLATAKPLNANSRSADATINSAKAVKTEKMSKVSLPIRKRK